MIEIELKIVDKNGEVLAQKKETDEVQIVYEQAYQPGDCIQFEISDKNQFVWLQLDDALGKSLVYLTGNFSYHIPFEEKRTNLSPKAFWGKRHLLSARVARDYEIVQYRNLAYNVCDQHLIKNLYPHATANVETRGEAVFAVQNAIDGVTMNLSHGEWPYESWGINRQDDARMRIDFGRKVCVDRLILYIRADFPHDNWWEQVSFSFSDGSYLDMKINKSHKAQEISFEAKKIIWIEMHDMKKANDPSPFPALTQLEVYGTESME